MNKLENQATDMLDKLTMKGRCFKCEQPCRVSKVDISHTVNHMCSKEDSCLDCGNKLEETNYSIEKRPNCIISCKCGYRADEWGRLK